MRGSLVEPYVARKNGLEAYSVPLPELEEILKETYGVLLYQESVLALSQRVAGYTLAKADQIRRAMTKDRGPDAMKEIREDFIGRTISRRIEAGKARDIFELVENFVAYGLAQPTLPALRRSLTPRPTCWPTSRPSSLEGGLLNSQPMGYYSPRRPG